MVWVFLGGESDGFEGFFGQPAIMPKANYCTRNNATLYAYLLLPEGNIIIPMLASPKPKPLAK